MDYEHGTSGYRHGCRCDKCKAAKATQSARYRRKKGIQPRTYLTDEERAEHARSYGLDYGRRWRQNNPEKARKVSREYMRTYRPATPIPHGVLSGYTVHRCRCELCRAANAAYMREWKRKARVKAEIQLNQGTAN